MPSHNLFSIRGCEKKENETPGKDGGTGFCSASTQELRNRIERNLLGEWHM